MKKFIASIVLLVFLFSCGPGAAVSRNLENIDVVVSPAAAGYKVALYSGGTFIGSTLTNAKGTATFANLPIGSYQATIYDPAGAKVTDKYFSSKYVAGPKAYVVAVKLAGAPAPQLPAQVCVPNQVWCVSPTDLKSCNSEGTAEKLIKCAAPTPWCVTEPSYTKCVECRTDFDCPAGKYCISGHVCAAQQVCSPNQIACKDYKTMSVCNSAGTAVKDTVCTAPKDMCIAGVGCVECVANTDCASGSCQNNVCVPPVAPGCVKCPSGRTDCKWVYRGLCEFEGKGGYPVCNTFIIYPQYLPLSCNSGNLHATVGGESGVAGTITVSGRSVNLYKAYDCMYCPATETITKPILGPVCGNSKCESGEDSRNCAKDCGDCIDDLNKNTITCNGNTCMHECAPDLNIYRCVFDWSSNKFNKVKQNCLNGICMNGVCSQCMPGDNKCVGSTYVSCSDGMYKETSCSGNTPYCVVTADNVYKGCYACTSDSHCPSGMVCKDYACTTPTTVARDFVPPVGGVWQCHPQGAIWITRWMNLGCAGDIWDPVETHLPYLIYYSKYPMPADTSVLIHCYWEYGGSAPEQVEQDLVLGTIKKCDPPARRIGQTPTRVAHYFVLNGNRVYTKQMPNTKEMFKCVGLKDPNHPWSYGIVISAYPDCYGDSIYRTAFRNAGSLGFWPMGEVR